MLVLWLVVLGDEVALVSTGGGRRGGGVFSTWTSDTGLGLGLGLGLLWLGEDMLCWSGGVGSEVTQVLSECREDSVLSNEVT